MAYVIIPVPGIVVVDLVSNKKSNALLKNTAIIINNKANKKNTIIILIINTPLYFTFKYELYDN